ncbi:MAG: hypothetical protein OXU29_02075 [Gammaproteobacteria bacterium]|nr:hypothetical protein [Gammaproteobacteria bacterium]
MNTVTVTFNTATVIPDSAAAVCELQTTVAALASCSLAAAGVIF